MIQRPKKQIRMQTIPSSAIKEIVIDDLQSSDVLFPEDKLRGAKVVVLNVKNDINNSVKHNSDKEVHSSSQDLLSTFNKTKYRNRSNNITVDNNDIATNDFGKQSKNEEREDSIIFPEDEHCTIVKVEPQSLYRKPKATNPIGLFSEKKINKIIRDPSSRYTVYDKLFSEEQSKIPKVALNSFFVIAKSVLPSETIDAIRNDLNMVPRVHGRPQKKDEAIGFYAFSEYDDAICTPRFYCMAKFPNIVTQALLKSNCNIIMDGLPMLSDITFNGTLRSNSAQEQAYDAIMRWYHVEQQWPSKGCIVQLPCGFGKTVLAILMAIKLGRKTLVLVHTDALVQQWCERIRTFAPKARIGIAKAQLREFEDRDFVVGTVQSFAKENNYSSEILNTFGFVIVDECHHIAARYFSTALFNLRPRYILGLSATPYRIDGLERLLEWSLGPIVFRAERDPHDQVRIAQIIFRAGKQINIRNKAGEYLRPTMINQLCDDVARNYMIVNTIVQLYRVCKYSGSNVRRKTIILSDRLEQLKIIEQLLQNKGFMLIQKQTKTADLVPKKKKLTKKQLADQLMNSQQENNNILATTNTDESFNNNETVNNNKSVTNNEDDMSKETVSFYIGATKPSERANASQADVILATYHIAAEGLDIPLLDTLILASPRTNIEQSIGRILRTAPGKSTPLVIDFVDPFGCFENMGTARHKIYRKFKYNIKQIEFVNMDAIVNFMSDDGINLQNNITTKKTIASKSCSNLQQQQPSIKKFFCNQNENQLKK